MVNEYRPSLDAGLGLIFRLNNLWNDADRNAINGNYDSWDNTLDVLWRNLSYREPLEVIGEGINTKVGLSSKDKRVWKILDKNVMISKRNWMISKKKYPKKVRKFWTQRYRCLEMKDLFLRKKMFQLKLYLKESDRNISGATFGKFGGG